MLVFFARLPDVLILEQLWAGRPIGAALGPVQVASSGCRPVRKFVERFAITFFVSKYF
ncbi:hypothetical protein [Mesorhizobium sp.]|uniref:hypothetical protein n=1 Tax=Mesorhizobium sp. TaxID=1871066 RepID=UPI0025D0A6E7|nr:hypothetical protein [Mesorhizobium sp.]